MGLFAGVGAYLGGISFVLRTRRTWPGAAMPALIALLLTGTLTAVGIHYASALVAHHASTLGATLAMIARGALDVVALALAVFIALQLAQPCAGRLVHPRVLRREDGVAITSASLGPVGLSSFRLALEDPVPGPWRVSA